MKKRLKIFGGILLSLIVVFIMGPAVDAPEIQKPLPTLSLSLEDLSHWVEEKNAAVPNIKEDNETKIVFADSIPKKTPYAIVYLHGFSGSAEDAAPVHEEVAKALGANLYLPRLYDHGLEGEEGLSSYTGERSLDSAREALAVGKVLGEKVILMGTSTGCTLALSLAAFHPDLAALVLYAPNIRIAHPLDFVATLPWGLQLLETAMNSSIFNRITVPVFSGYYYKNDQEQDPVVSVAAMRTMFKELGTSPENKQEMAFPNAGAHEIASYLVTDNYDEVKEATLSFLNRILE